MDREYARSAKGQRAYGSKPARRKGNVTILGALSLMGIVAAMSIEGAADGVVFLTFIKQILVPQLSKGKVVVMDNVRTHKVKGVEEAIEAIGARVVYLPPYSPELNPIEECWSKFKTYLRKKAARVQEELDKAISEAFKTITSKDALGWFAHAGY